MKILMYNWAPVGCVQIGGGISMYMNNIARYFSENDNYDFEITFLGSGYYYDKNNKSCYVRQEKDVFGIKAYSIVNSPIIGPMEVAACDISTYSQDEISKKIFDNFIQDYGPFDIIHFHSLEGVSSNVLSLKEKYPETKFFHSIHDYGLFCPNVKLWHYANDSNCYIMSEHNCMDCLGARLNKSVSLMKEYRPKSFDSINKKKSIYRRAIIKTKKAFGFYKSDSNLTSADFVYFREHNVEMINKYVDSELCVSKRVSEVAIKYGVNPKKVIVDYIGTKAAETTLRSNRTPIDTETFTILYMGYATKQKGFFTILHALENTNFDCTHVALKFASKITDKNIIERLRALEEKYAKVTLYDGYTHSDFPVIMDGVNLGIVPPLWEDNLPQVTIEMIANGVPVMTSLNGGAHELNDHEAFKFVDASDFVTKIEKLIKNRKLLKEYWDHSSALTTMHKHIENLKIIYEGHHI